MSCRSSVIQLLVDFSSTELTAVDQRSDVLIVPYQIESQTVMDPSFKMLVLGVPTCVSHMHDYTSTNTLKFSSHVALIENITTSHDDTTVVLHWNPVLEHVISHFDIECFYTKQNTKHSAQSTVAI